MPTGPIVHLSTARTWRGGEQQALYLAQGLHERGRPTLVVTPPDTPLAARAREAGVRVEELHCRGEFDLLAMWKLSRLLKREQARLLHAHDAHGVTIGAFAGRWAGVPRLCTRRVDFAVKSAWKYSWGMDRVICISAAIKKICVAGGIPEDKLRVVPSGIDLARVQDVKADAKALRAGLGEGKKRRLIALNVASLTDHKGQKYLLEAIPAVLAKLPQALFVIVGDGELEAELKQQANILALDEDVLVFTGFRDDVPALLQACDLFVISSHLEGLCTSVMDAMAAGKAVVATTAGGLPEVVADGQTGLLVPPRDPEKLAQALLELLIDRKRRERFGRAAAELAARRFGMEKMVEGTLAAYQELLEKGRCVEP